MTKTLLKIFVSVMVVGGSLAGLLSCKEKREAASADAHLAKDSVYVWIERSKQPELTSEKQAAWLSRAYDEVSSRQDDSIKVEFLSRISLQYLRMMDSLRFRETSSETLELAHKVGDSVNHAEAHWDLATFFGRYSMPDSAFYHYGEAYKIFNALEDNLFSGRMLNNMALIQADIKDYIGSEINSIRAIERLKPLDAAPYLYTSYSNLGTITRELGENERALEYFNTALDYLKDFDSTNYYTQLLLNNIGNVYQVQNQHKEAITYYETPLGSTIYFKRIRNHMPLP